MFTGREIWTIIHGMFLGGLLIVAFPGVLFGLWSLQKERLTETGIHRNLGIVATGTRLLAVLSWVTVLSGTYIPYPWYRAQPPPGADLTMFPMAYLLANPKLAFLEDYAMEWKEHLAWFVPVLTTAVASVIGRYRAVLLEEARIRKAMLALLTIAFIASIISGLMGALVTKIAPVR